MSVSTMETYFSEMAAFLDGALAPGEVYTCTLDAEVSDFVRMNLGKIRQPGTVAQRYVRLHLIRGRKHAEHCQTVTGDLARDRDALWQALASLRDTVADLPDDPHLDFATDVHSSRVVRSTPMPAPEGVIATVLDAAKGLDLVGIYAAGPVYRGFANSLGQRNWHEVTSFNLQWSLYHRADKAVKTAYGGFDWSDRAFAAKMHGARERLALLAVPARSLEPGTYRAYLTPTAMEEIAGMLCWGGFSGRALATRQSCLFRMQEGATELAPSISFAENTAQGVAPAFQDEGFARPGAVPLVNGGKLVGSLVNPRTAKEFSLTANGANAAESPESLDMAPGELSGDEVLAALDTGLYLGNLWYLNFSDRPACRVTGMTRFASFWVDKGRIVAPVNVMRFDDSVFRLLGERLVGLTSESELLLSDQSYRARSVSSMRLPGAVVGEMAFTL
ncbi:MAG TPA: metallopeptidase TldD-related protein [Casimicrobiaceae bacterium]|jgi:predicted Zn-dependent protease